MEQLAQLTDADTTLNLARTDAGKYRVEAVQCDGCSLPRVVLDGEYDTLGQAIKAITVFFTSEWESVFITNRLSEKMKDSIQAS